MNKRPTQKVMLRLPSKTVIGKIFGCIGIQLNSFELGYLHGHTQTKKYKSAFVVEKQDGRVVIVPNKNKYFRTIS